MCPLDNFAADRAGRLPGALDERFGDHGGIAGRGFDRPPAGLCLVSFGEGSELSPIVVHSAAWIPREASRNRHRTMIREPSWDLVDAGITM